MSTLDIGDLLARFGAHGISEHRAYVGGDPIDLVSSDDDDVIYIPPPPKPQPKGVVADAPDVIDLDPDTKSVPRHPESDLEKKLIAMCREQGYNPVGNEDGTERLLYAHQYDNVCRFYAEASRTPSCGLLIADVPGLGKTTSASMCIGIARSMNASIHGAAAPRCTIIVAPSNIIPQWIDEIKSLYPSWTVVRFGVIKELDAANTDVVITTYGTLVSEFQKVFERKSGGKKKLPKPSESGDPEEAGWVHIAGHTSPLIQTKFAAFIADEGHILRNTATIGHHAAIAVARLSFGRVVLTGTPFVNYASDIVSLMCIAHGRPKLRRDNVFANVVKTKNIEFLHRTTLIRHTKEILNLPKVHRDEVDIVMEESERNAIRLAAENLSGHVNAKNQAGVLRALTNVRKASISRHMIDVDIEDDEGAAASSNKRKRGHAGGEQVGDAKTQKHAVWMRQQQLAEVIFRDPSRKMTKAFEIIVGFATEQRPRKTVVFCTFIAPLVALQMMLDARFGEGCAPLLRSGMKDEERAALIRAPRKGVTGGTFHTDPKCKALLSTYKSGGVGLNLAPAASAVVMLDMWWNRAVMEQAEDRVYRIGADRTCEFRTIVNDGAFDTACKEIYHERKDKNASILVDGEFKVGEESVKIVEEAEDSILNAIIKRITEIEKTVVIDD